MPRAKTLTPAQLQQRRDAGSKGGAATRERYGASYFRILGRRGGIKGGRPTFQQTLTSARRPAAVTGSPGVAGLRGPRKVNGAAHSQTPGGATAEQGSRKVEA